MPDVSPGSVQQPSLRQDELDKSRISLGLISRLCLCLLCGLLGYRIRQFHQRFLKHMTLTHVYVFIDYISAITFNISAAIVYNGLGTTTSRTCEATIRLCLLFYTAGKVSMYLFLVERVHVLRAPYRSRFGDCLWLLSTITIFFTLGAIGVAGSVSPVTSVSEADGICRIGLQPYAIIPLLVCDIVINMFLTSVFVYLLSPLVRESQSSDAGFVSRLARTVASMCRWTKPEGTINLHPTNQVIIRRVEKLLWKTLIGCVLVVLPAAGNLTALCVLRGHMPAFMCLTICIIDVTWAAVVLHWLTVASADRDKSRYAASTAFHDRGSQRSESFTLRRKSVLSAISQELCALDANMIAEECLDKLQLDEGGPVMELNRRPSSHSAASKGTESGHSTLVVDSGASRATDQ